MLSAREKIGNMATAAKVRFAIYKAKAQEKVLSLFSFFSFREWNLLGEKKNKRGKLSTFDA